MSRYSAESYDPNSTWSNDSSSAFVSMDPFGNPMDDQHRSRRYQRNNRNNRYNNKSGRDTIEQFRDEYSGSGSGTKDWDNRKTTYDNNANRNDTEGDDDEEEVYIVRQEYAYCSIGFSMVQTFIMGLLMWQCGVAPLNVNPMVGPWPDALSEWGGKNSTLILDDGEWWRIITPILLHAGLLHLFANVAVQLEAGAFFEKEWGSWRWLLIYLGSAVGSSALSVITMPDAVSVGSSGAVMGLFGGKLAEVLLRCAERTDTKEQQVSSQVRKEQCISVTCSVVVVMAFSFVPYVDWAAHLGGLLGGLAIGVSVFAFELEYVSCKSIWVIIGLALTGGSYFAALWYMYNGDVEVNDALRDVCGYYKEQFDDYECRCTREEYRNNDGGGSGD